MKYFDDISNLFGKRQEEIQAEKEKGRELSVHVPVCSTN
jgi:hypothetical protein